MGQAETTTGPILPAENSATRSDILDRVRSFQEGFEWDRPGGTDSSAIVDGESRRESAAIPVDDLRRLSLVVGVSALTCPGWIVTRGADLVRVDPPTVARRETRRAGVEPCADPTACMSGRLGGGTASRRGSFHSKGPEAAVSPRREPREVPSRRIGSDRIAACGSLESFGPCGETKFERPTARDATRRDARHGGAKVLQLKTGFGKGDRPRRLAPRWLAAPRSKPKVVRRPDLDNLEGRQLMAFSALGYSRPDLLVSGYAAPVASYGQPLSLVIDVRNLGATSIREPLGFFDSRAAADPTLRYPTDAFTASTTADAPESVVRVFLSRTPRLTPRAVQLADINVPNIRQNSLVRLLPEDALPPNVAIEPHLLPPNGIQTQTINTAPTINLPAVNDPRVADFPVEGTLYLILKADATHVVAEHDETNNFSTAIPIRLAPVQPNFEAVGFDAPRGMQPGDLIRPRLLISNTGTANVPLTEPLRIDLVATRDAQLDANDIAFASYQVDQVAPLTLAPTRRLVPGARNLVNPANIRRVDPFNSPLFPTSPNVRIPNSTNRFNIGLVVDPENRIKELREPRPGPVVRLAQLRKVGEPMRGIGPINESVRGEATRPLNFPRRP